MGNQCCSLTDDHHQSNQQQQQHSNSPITPSSSVPKERRRLSVSHVVSVHELVAQSSDEMIRGISNSSPHHRMSIVGAPVAAIQKEYDDKKSVHIGDIQDPSTIQLGYCCKKGLKPESPNQDDFAIIRFDEWALYGVFDGHGPFGHDISNFVHKILPSSVMEHPLFNTNPRVALFESFLETQKLIAKCDQEGKFDASLSGTTSTVCLVKDNNIYTAWTGDSRAVLARTNFGSKGKNSYIASDLSKDHKPDQPNEMQRIMSSGGLVRRLEGDVCYRVFMKSKMYPGLAMSRSLGDQVAQSVGVSCQPDTEIVPITEDESFFLLCSDGVWEFISSQEAVNIISSYSRQEVQKACEALAAEAWKRWISEEGNVVDDITVICQWLPKL